MSEEEFQRHKESMSRHLLDKPKKLATMSDLFWAEIATQQYNFDRPNVENVFLSTVKKEDLVKFCKVKIIFFVWKVVKLELEWKVLYVF